MSFTPFLFVLATLSIAIAGVLLWRLKHTSRPPYAEIIEGSGPIGSPLLHSQTPQEMKTARPEGYGVPVTTIDLRNDDAGESTIGLPLIAPDREADKDAVYREPLVAVAATLHSGVGDECAKLRSIATLSLDLAVPASEQVSLIQNQIETQNAQSTLCTELSDAVLLQVPERASDFADVGHTPEFRTEASTSTVPDRPESSERNIPWVGQMRITKRSSGGRGEYEISEQFGTLSPRDLVGRGIVLDLGSGICINTHVVLRDLQGKRRLRMDASAGCEMHLHRQLAAALLMPRTARDEKIWGDDATVLRAGLYGIGNITLSEVHLRPDGTVHLTPDEVEVANSAHEGHFACRERMADLHAVWADESGFPPVVGRLLREHEQRVRSGGPLGESLEETVALLQRALDAQRQVLGITAAPDADPLPVLLQLLLASREQPSRVIGPSPSEESAPEPEIALEPLGNGRTAVDGAQAGPLPDIAPAAPVLIATSTAPPAESLLLLQVDTVRGPEDVSLTDAAAEVGQHIISGGEKKQEEGPSPTASVSEPTTPLDDDLNRAPRDAEDRVAVEQVDKVSQEDEESGPEDILPPEAALPSPDSLESRRADKAAKRNAPPVPHRYQPAQRGSIAARRASPEKGSAGSLRERACSIEVRLRNHRGGTVIVSLLPGRREGMPAAIDVAGGGSDRLAFSALREGWYQDLLLSDTGTILRVGAAWYSDTEDGRLRWSLGGRDLYVLKTHDELSGFVSTSRLVLKDEHAVLCTLDLVPQVEALLEQSCGSVPSPLGEDDGVPQGWVCFRPFVPTTPLSLGPVADVLDALRPSADVEIALRGGIRLQYTQWLAGHPPAIRLYGDAARAGTLVIDGFDAVVGTDGSFTVPGWDTPGEHFLSCAGQTKSYIIVEPEDKWEVWTAYSFLQQGPQAMQPGICGAFVFASSPDHAPWQSVLVPSSNPVILGRVPGQIYCCPARQDVFLPLSSAFVPFDPVWAVPSDPLHVDKATARVLPVGTEKPAYPSERGSRVLSRERDVRRWCAAILDCARKGLTVEPVGEATGAWQVYRDLAKQIWRSLR